MSKAEAFITLHLNTSIDHQTKSCDMSNTKPFPNPRTPPKKQTKTNRTPDPSKPCLFNISKSISLPSQVHVSAFVTVQRLKTTLSKQKNKRSSFGVAFILSSRGRDRDSCVKTYTKPPLKWFQPFQKQTQ